MSAGVQQDTGGTPACKGKHPPSRAVLDVGSNSFPEFSVGNMLMEGREGAQTARIRNPSSSFTHMNVTILVVVIKAGMTSNKLLIQLEELLGLRTKC